MNEGPPNLGESNTQGVHGYLDVTSCGSGPFDFVHYKSKACGLSNSDFSLEVGTGGELVYQSEREDANEGQDRRSKEKVHRDTPLLF